MSEVSRREFVKAASAVTASGPRPHFQLGQFKKTRDPIKIGFIGCGGRGTGAANQALNSK